MSTARRILSPPLRRLAKPSPRASRPGSPSRARIALLYAFPALIVATSWLALEDPRRGGKVLLAALLAVVPALVRPLFGKLLAIAVVSAVVVANALELSAFDARPFDDARDFFGPAFARFRDGVLAFYDVAVPFDPTHHARMHGVIALAVYAFCLPTALAIAARRPLLAALFLSAGAAWPATLVPDRNSVRLGGFLLSALFVLLIGLRADGRRVPRPALFAGLVVLVVALAAATSPAVAKDAFLNWKRWDVQREQHRRVSVSYVWASRYDGIRFPKKATPVLRISAPSRSLYWRATVLDQFNGYGWTQSLDWIVPEARDGRDVLADDASYPIGARNPRRWIEQRITVEALEDDHLIGGGVPVAYQVDGDATVAYAAGGIAWVPERIHRGDRYVVWSYAPQPSPAQLLHARPRYPRAVTNRSLTVAGASLPAFRAPGRRQVLAHMFAQSGHDDRIQPYRALYEQAVAVAGRAKTPYEAAAAVETWLRSAGGFRYDEQPPPPRGLPPLVDFVTRTRAGYCQHFAGAMALMLRYLGIPARVAAGFTSGTYDAKARAWTVTDHDAHTWVEVWFNGFGWLPFDPTPGRGSLDGSYTASSRSFDKAVSAFPLTDLLNVSENRLRAGLERARSTSAGAGGAADGGGRGGMARVTTRLRDRSPSLLLLLMLVALGAVVVIALAKLTVRRSRYLTRDPRRIAAACRRELLDFLRDQSLEPPPGATLTDVADELETKLGVHGRRFVAAATAARFGSPDQAAEEARRSRRELRSLLRVLRRRLSGAERARGLLSLRSLGFG
jgi:transglutaminase-like putative cysteine protease